MSSNIVNGRDARTKFRDSIYSAERSKFNNATSHRSMVLLIDMPPPNQPSAQPLAQPSSSSKEDEERTRNTLIFGFHISFLTCNYIIGFLFFADLLLAEGMRVYAIISFTIAVLGLIIGLVLEVVLALGKRTKVTQPVLLASIGADLLPSILVSVIIRYGPNCAYAISMSEFGSAAMVMMLFTLVNSVRKCAIAIIVRKDKSIAVPFSVISSYLAFMCGLYLVFNISPLINVDCRRPMATFRITANTGYPIVDCNNSTESSFGYYAFETTIEAKFNKAQLLRNKTMTIKTDCRHLAGFDQLLGGTERDEECTLTASTTDPNHDDDGNRTLQFSLDIVIADDVAVSSVRFCPQDDELDGATSLLDYRPSRDEIRKIFGAYCRIGSDETVYECPTMTKSAKMQFDQSPIALFDCTRMCFARPPIDQSKKQATIGNWLVD